MRGYQKRVVCLKNTGSDLFEEAYFIVKSGHEETDLDKRQKMLIEEAGRIIEECLCNGDKKRAKIPICALLYAAGFFSAALIAVLVFIF